MIFKGKTLEGFISFWFGLFTFLCLAFAIPLMWILAIPDGLIALLTFVMLLAAFFATNAIRLTIVSSFRRALQHLEAVRQEDYKHYAKSTFQQGVVGEFHQHLRNISDDLLEKKQRYDQHAFLVYQLISQLDTPVLVFNQKEQLTYANSAFSLLYDGQPWQQYRNASPKLLDLAKINNNWQLQHNYKSEQQWQISQSTFIDAGLAHQLLVFTNIESALRSSQINAWQQITRVIGHEIRNSLTPVSTIAQSLAARADNTRDNQALALISERCVHLQDFINRYASLSKPVNLNYQIISVTKLRELLQGLFTDIELETQLNIEQIWGDKSSLEQVLINLIKNAQEADASEVIFNVSETQNNNTNRRQTLIKVSDNGHGFANIENLFVPLYSTKPEGQGIGLSFCRNIIEQHQGKINLVNNRKAGVTVEIILPSKPKANDVKPDACIPSGPKADYSIPKSDVLR